MPLQDIQPQLLALSPAEKAQAIQLLLQSLSDTRTGIEKTLGVCGGDARIANTRIPIWVLIQARNLGNTDAQILTNYFLVAGSLYWFLYSALKQTLETRKLHRLLPTQQGIRRDIELTIVSVIVFALSAAIILFLFKTGATLIYINLTPGQVWYGAVSFAAVVLLQDAYFYFTHPALHHPQLFKGLHHGHHQSGAPTP